MSATECTTTTVLVNIPNMSLHGFCNNRLLICYYY